MSSPMFVLAVPPRPLLLAEQINDTSFAFRFPSSPPFNTITVALAPGQSIPPEFAAGVYYSLPSSPDSFRFIGYLGQGRDSGTYRIISAEVNPAAGMRTDGEGDAMLDESESLPTNGSAGVVTVGVMVKPAQEVANEYAAFKAALPAKEASGAAVGKVETKVLAQRIIGNAFNFLSSFGSEQIPLKAFQEWWKKFEGKVERDPSFLERPQD